MIPHVEDSNKIEAEELTYYDSEKTNKITWKDHLLLNRPLKVIVILLLTSTLSPLLIYYYIFFNNSELPPSDGFSFGSCLVPRESRIPCGVGLTDELDCHAQCCYDLDNNFCFHRFPSRFTYLTPTNQAWNDSVILTPRIDTVPYKSQLSLPRIRLHIDEVSSTHLTLSFNSQQSPQEGRKLVDKQYTYEISSPELNIFVNRTQQTDNNVIFNTNRGVTIASENIWEISFVMTQETMYGFGEIPLKASDKIIYNYEGGSNSIPIIFAKSGNEYHGLLFDVFEPTELKIQEDNQIVVRSLTNNGLKFHLFVGPEPKDIMKDVNEFIGFNGSLEYWMLGAHICSELPETSNNLEKFLDKYSEESIPFDSHCGTQPIVFENEAVDLDRLKNDGELLKKYQKRIVPHVSPYIRYNVENEAEMQDKDTLETPRVTKKINTEVFKEFILRNPDGDIYVGEIKNQSFVYPDYENAPVEFMKRLWQSDTEIDGVVLENSWPTDDSIKTFDEIYEALPYFNQNFEAAFKVTPQWNIEGSNGAKYFYTHNLYGNNFADAFAKIFTKEPPIWASSQWRNGKVSVNQQNVETSWASLQTVLISTALGGISGQRLWSTPICGDTENFDLTYQTNLCTKWYMAATYLPVIKIHSKEIARHPLAFSGTNKKYMTTALKNRMSLLPYFYTTLQKGPLLRPMFYQFPSSESLADLTSQFSVGDDMLIVPNLLPNQSHVHVWLPPGTWYELWSGYQIEGNEGEPVTMTTTEADLLSLIRGGSVVTLQKDVKSTADITRLQSDFSLIIALECNQNKTSCNATGDLYIDTDMSILLTADSEGVTIKSSGTNFEHLCTDKAISAKLIKYIQIYGLAEEFNNYDHRRIITIDTDLCLLESNDSIRIEFM